MNQITLLQDSKSQPWRSEAEHATSRSRRIPSMPNLYYYTEEKLFFLRPEALELWRDRRQR